MSISFLSPLVLAGAASLAVPIIIHLLLKRKPKHVVFPTLRLLKQKQRTTLQKLRLRHLLLLALRLLLLLCMVLAMAKPLLSGGGGLLAPDSPVALVLIFDTSVSMDYQVSGKSNLDLAKEKALRIIDGLSFNSQVAVFDTAEPGGQFVGNREAAKLVQTRRIQFANRPVTACLDEAYRLLDKAAPDLPLLFVIFSDRTAASWDAEVAGTFLTPGRTQLEAKLGRPIKTIYFDIGAAEPRNVAIVGLALRQAGETNARPLEQLNFGSAGRESVQLQATVQTVGAAVDNELLLVMDGKVMDRKRLKLTAAPNQLATEIVTFTPMKLTDLVHQGEVKLVNKDALEADNVRYWTLVSPPRKVLLLADELEDAGTWSDALASLPDPVPTDVRRPEACPPVLVPDQYQAIVLVNVAKPAPALWETLNRYVTAGGGLVISPGADVDPAAYGTPAAQELLPGLFTSVEEVPLPGAYLELTSYEHPLLAPFKIWETQITNARVYRFWNIDLTPGRGGVVVNYSIEAKSKPAIVERLFDRQKVQGRVVVYTTSLYTRRTQRGWKDWNNYLESWIAVALPYVTMNYILDARGERSNCVLGDEIKFLLPQTPRFPEFILSGPQSGRGKVPENARFLAVLDARRPGRYTLTDGTGNFWQRYFSVNLPALETQLLQDRPTVEQLDAVFGPKSVQAGQDEIEVREIVRDTLGQQAKVDLLPYLMAGVLLFLALENWLANRFYRREDEAA